MIQLPLFPDLTITPTPAMRAGRSQLLQCDWCGTLICTPSPSQRPPGPCPCCDGHRRWSDERSDDGEIPGGHIVGPFFSSEVH